MARRFVIVWLILMRALSLTASAAAPCAIESREKKIAILDFVNDGPYERLDYLKYLLPQILISGLAGEEGIAVLKRHHLEPLIDESALAESGFLEGKSFALEEADIIVEGSWAEQPEPGLSFEETPLLIKITLTEGASGKILGEIEVTGEREEFAGMQKELIAGILHAISSRRFSMEGTKEVVSSWEAGEYMGRGLSIMKSFRIIPVPSNDLPRLRIAIEFFKRTAYLEPESSIAYNNIAGAYRIMQYSRNLEEKKEGTRGAAEWYSRIVDTFWQDDLVSTNAMKELMLTYRISSLAHSGAFSFIPGEDEIKEWLRRMGQCMEDFVYTRRPDPDVSRAIWYGGEAARQMREYEHAAEMYRTILRKCRDAEWWENEQERGEYLHLTVHNLDYSLRMLGRHEEALQEVESAIERSPGKTYELQLHAMAVYNSFVRLHSYETAKIHFARAVELLESMEDGWREVFAQRGSGKFFQRVIEDNKCDDRLKHEALRMLLQAGYSELDLVRILKPYVDSYPPAAVERKRLLKELTGQIDGANPFRDTLNRILWTPAACEQKLYSWTRMSWAPAAFGARPRSIGASLRRKDSVWIAGTAGSSDMPRLGLWKLNLLSGRMKLHAAGPDITGKHMGVTALAETEGNFFVGTTDGLYILNQHKEWRRITPDDGLPLPEVTALAVDGDSLWIACGALRSRIGGIPIDRKALSRYLWQERTFKTYPAAAMPTALLSDKDGLWVGVWGGGVYRMDEETGKYTEIRPAKARVFDYVKAFTWEGDKIWCSTFRKTLLIEKANKEALFSRTGNVNHIAQDRDCYWLALQSRELVQLGPNKDERNILSLNYIPKAIYPADRYIWVIGDRVKGLRREVLSLQEETLKQIAAAFRLKRIDFEMAAEELEKIKLILPESAGLRLEIADCYRSLYNEEKSRIKKLPAAERAIHEHRLDSYQRKLQAALREAGKLAPESAIVLGAVQSVERHYKIKVLEEK